MDKRANDIIKSLENGKFKFLGMEDTFKFSCSQCGSCCTERYDILLYPHEVARIAQHLNISTAEVLNKYCSIYLGSQSKIPIVAIKNIPKYKGTVKHCSFLKRDGMSLKCSIHEVKPTVCAIYPLGRTIENNNDKTEFKYFLQPTGCSGCKTKKEISVKNWIGGFNLQDSEKASDDFTAFLSQLNKVLNLKKFADHEVITQKTKEMLYDTYINVLYADIPKDKNLLEELQARYKLYLDSVSNMVAKFREIGIDI